MRALIGIVVTLLVITGCTLTDEEHDAGSAAGVPPVAEPVPEPSEETAAPEGPGEPGQPTSENSAAPGRGALPQDVPVHSAAGLPAPREQSAPVRVEVPALEADVPIDPVGVESDGEMEIPEDAARAGWYRFGPTAGSDSGTVVLAAHAGSNITPLGPLRNLIDLSAGDLINVTREDGVTLTYVVESAELIPKATIDLDEHFRREGEHRLVLFTCDGEWQDDVWSYTDNAVVTATLATS